MEAISDGCRLCLDPFAENSCSIESPDLKEQMAKVFHFPIAFEDGYPKKVCQSCAYTIAEFYQYSEKVRRNQEQLHLTSSTERDTESKPEIEEIKVEPLIQRRVSPRGSEEQSSDSVEPKEESAEVSDEASANEIFAEPYEPAVAEPKKTRKRKTRAKRKRTEEDLDSDEDEQKPKNKKKRSTLTKEEREKGEKAILEFYLMVCELCGYQASNFSELDSHFLDEHERSGYVVCCKKKLFNRRYMVQHMNLHENPSAFRCELCKKNYKSKEYLLMHQLKTHGNEEDRPFKCDRCPQSFAKKFLLKAHLATHEKAKCPQCDRLLASKAALKAHITNMHSDVDRRMICDTCGQEFLNKASFERHVKEHMGIEVMKKFQCQICYKWLTGERGLQNHIQYTHYEKGQQYTCEICHQQSPNSRALWKHKRVVHCEEKYECEFCGRKFKQKIALKEHRTIHTGEVLYSCDICGVTKNSKANLYVHIKKNHYTEWLQKQLKAAQPNVSKSQS